MEIKQQTGCIGPDSFDQSSTEENTPDLETLRVMLDPHSIRGLRGNLHGLIYPPRNVKLGKQISWQNRLNRKKRCASCMRNEQRLKPSNLHPAYHIVKPRSMAAMKEESGCSSVSESPA